MFKLIKFIIGLGFIVAVLIVGAQFLGFSQNISADQEEIRSLYGAPEQFMITYVPQGNDDNIVMARQEIWYYPKHEKKIIFIAGNAITVDEFIPEEEIVAPTSLRPEDFNIDMNYNDLVAIMGELNLEKVEIPVLFEEGEIETYYSDQAIFVIEGEYLTYVQTIGIGNN